MGAKSPKLQRVEVAKRYRRAPLSVKANGTGVTSEWRSGSLRRLPVEGFKGHVATDGSLLGSAGKWRACGWAVVQLDHDEEMEPLHGMYGSMEAALEVQRTIKRAELTAFFLRST